MTSLSGAVGLLDRAIGYTIGGLSVITPEALSRPTPCPEWDLRALLRHVADSLAALSEAVDDGHVPVDIPAAGVDEAADPVALIRERARRALGSWAGAGAGGHVITVGGCPMRADVVACVGAIEVAVHGWDIYRACGSPRPIPPALAADLLEFAPALVTDAERPARFAAPIPLPPAASAGERLVAFLGRDPA